MIEAREFAKVMAYLSAALQKPVTVETIDVYYDLLQDLPLEVLRAAAKQVVLEHVWATFPSVAELRQAAVEAMRGPRALTAGEAWGKASKVLANIDPEIAHNGQAGTGDLANVRCPCAGCKLGELPPEVRRVVDSFGLASMLDRETPVSVIRAQFERAFADRQEAEFKNALLPPAVRQAIARIGRPEAITEAK